MPTLTIANLGLGASRMPRSAQHCLQSDVSSRLMTLVMALLMALLMARLMTADNS